MSSTRRPLEERGAPMRPDPGSFRDPDGQVYSDGERVLRALSQEGLAQWQHVSGLPFYARAMRDGTLVETTQLEDAAAAEALGGEVAGLLRHDRVPFISYPYEWSFGMLKDAAVLQLELLAAALEDGAILKDGSAYNVQWRGTSPVFIDTGSLERHRDGEPWAGYRQFCCLCLYPLLLQSYRGVPFQPWLRGRLEGISPQEAARLITLRDVLRPGVLTHVRLHSRLERRHADERGVRDELRNAGFRRELVQATVARLLKLVQRIEWQPERSEWSDYASTTPYTAEDQARKGQLVEQAVRGRRFRLAWDLGCNDGRYTRLAAASADCTLALDADHAVVERLYRELRAEDNRGILPLVADVCDPSPGLGWRGTERRALEERGRPELVLCLALVHHVAISRNVALGSFVDWLRGLGALTVVEFASEHDPMVQRLIGRKRPGLHGDYTRENFEQLLADAFTVDHAETLPSGTRTVYVLRTKR